VTEPDLAVRRTVAREHGLPVNAIQFLSGETVTEVEQSASRLAAVFRERNEQHERAEQARSPSGFFDVAAAEKAERKRTLVNALTGRVQQPRDHQGKFAAADQPAVGFDGGVREPVRRIESHESWLAAALDDRRADVGSNF
jgi:hypothetical protein